MGINCRSVKIVTLVTAVIIALTGGGGVGGYYGMKEMAEVSTEADIFRRDIIILSDRLVVVEQKLDSIQDVTLRMDTKLDILVTGYRGD